MFVVVFAPFYCGRGSRHYSDVLVFLILTIVNSLRKKTERRKIKGGKETRGKLKNAGKALKHGKKAQETKTRGKPENSGNENAGKKRGERKHRVVIVQKCVCLFFCLFVCLFVWKPINTNPGLKVDQGFSFPCRKMFKTPMFFGDRDKPKLKFGGRK